MKREWIAPLMLGISAALLLAFVALPLASLFAKAFQGAEGGWSLENFRAYFQTPNLLHSLRNTLWISALTTGITLVLAFLYAYALSRTGLRAKGLFRFVGMLPLFAPTMMLGIGLQYLLGNKGLLTMMGLRIPLYGPVGIVISEVLYAFPQALMILSVALTFADQRLYDAAESMGASPMRRFWTITLPGARYGILSAAFVSFSMCFTDFGAPKVVGGNFNVLATDIYKQVVGQQNFRMGAVVGILLMLPAALSFAADRWGQRSRRGVTVTAKTTAFRLARGPLRDGLYTAFCAAIAACMLGVFGAVLLASVVRQWPYDLSPTIEHFLYNSPSTGGLRSFGNSLVASAATALVGTALVFLTAYLVGKTKQPRWLSSVASGLALLPLALPGLAIGIAYILFFSDGALRPLYGTAVLLVAANVAHLFSVPFVTAKAALQKLDPEFETVSDSMNVPRWRTFLRVTLPMSLPALLEVALYLFVNAMVTVSAVIFLYPPGFKLAAVAIVNLEDAGETAKAAALSVYIIATNMSLRLLYEAARRRLQARAAGGAARRAHRGKVGNAI